MSRSGYDEEIEDMWSYIRYRGQVASAIRGKRGKAFLKELAEALDSMADKQLITETLQSNGHFCALGVICHKRGLDLNAIDAYDPSDVAGKLGIAWQLAAEIAEENDEAYVRSAEERWQSMREWVQNNLSMSTP